jgi:hypothetical protein
MFRLVTSSVAGTNLGECDVTLQPTSSVESIDYFRFSPRELARLGVYRAAVNARFYTDQCEPLPEPDENAHAPVLEASVIHRK